MQGCDCGVQEAADLADQLGPQIRQSSNTAQGQEIGCSGSGRLASLVLGRVPNESHGSGEAKIWSLWECFMPSEMHGDVPCRGLAQQRKEGCSSSSGPGEALSGE